MLPDLGEDSSLGVFACSSVVFLVGFDQSLVNTVAASASHQQRHLLTDFNCASFFVFAFVLILQPVEEKHFGNLPSFPLCCGPLSCALHGFSRVSSLYV